MSLSFFLLLILFLPAFSGVIGITTHPLKDEARVLSAEMTGYMSLRHEVGMGLRYTQELTKDQLLDVSAAAAQDSRSAILGAGTDIAILREEIAQPRVSLKPFYQYQKYEDVRTSTFGVAPAIRKGLAIYDREFFPFLALPAGMKFDDQTNEFVYLAALSLGATIPLPQEHLLLSFEANKNLGASSDSLTGLVSWIWN